jgi:hypothetical protein
MNLKIKILTGFREDQCYTIDAEEAHKAYYLFLNPEKRGVFSNGVALIGKNIQGIQPDYNASMGYNPDYEFNYEDWNEVQRIGLKDQLAEVLEKAKKVADLMEDNPQLVSMTLTEAKQILPTKFSLPETKQLSEKFKV